MRTSQLAALILLAALWGAQYLFLRVAPPVLGPIFLTDLRVLLAGAVLVPCAFAAGRLSGYRKGWRRFLVLGTLSAAIPFALIAVAVLNLTASLAAILNAATPLFAALVALVWLKEPLTKGKIAGLLLGICGVVVLMGFGPLPLTGDVALSVGACLLAALSLALGGIYAGQAFESSSPLILATGQQLSAGLLLLPFAAIESVMEPPPVPPTTVVGCVLGAALLSGAVGFPLYFHLIGKVGPTKTLTVTFLMPGFGLLWGALFLGEAVTPSVILGLGIILLSITLVAEVGPFARKNKGEARNRENKTREKETQRA